MSKPSGIPEDDDSRNDTAECIRGCEHTSRKDPVIDRIRSVVTDESMKRIDGLLVDLFSASITVQVYDALNEENKAKMAALPVRKMVNVALRVANRASA